MPELPEVETISRSLQSNLGAKIIQIDIRNEDIIRLREYDPEKIYSETITEIRRRGKFLVFTLENRLNLIFHMGMSGRLYMADKDVGNTETHVHVKIYLDNGITLFYQDVRRFGGLWFVKDLQDFFAGLGKEPLSDEFTAQYLAKTTKNRKQVIKNMLLNQKLICGIGNIYADEALFEAAIRPDRPAGSLSAEEIKRLCQAIKEILRNSIEKYGTTLRDYRDGFNQPGRFQEYLKVYGKTNEKCPRCGGVIIKNRIGGRSSYFCENCQK